MNSKDAQFILSGYRPGGQDASDPLFAAALEQAKRDPGLGQWLAQQQAHAAAVADKLKDIPPPPHLRQAVLAGANLTQPPVRSGRLRPAFVGLAAAAAVLAVGLFTVLPVKNAMAVEQLEAFAIQDAQTVPHGRPVGSAASDLKAHLELEGVCLATGLHFDFETLRTTGCRTLTSDGHEMVELCFKRNGDFYHLYIVKRADFTNLKAKAFSGTRTQAGVSFVSWADEGYFYMLASRATPGALERLL
jgi:hypothetical protein